MADKKAIQVVNSRDLMEIDKEKNNEVYFQRRIICF